MSFFYFSDEETVNGARLADTAVLSVGGELDYAASPQLKERLSSVVKAGTRHLVLDLSAVSFIDSTAIGVLVGIAGKLDAGSGGSLVIVCANPNVLRIFELTGLDSMVGLHDSREDALSALAPAG